MTELSMIQHALTLPDIQKELSLEILKFKDSFGPKTLENTIIDVNLQVARAYYLGKRVGAKLKVHGTEEDREKLERAAKDCGEGAKMLLFHNFDSVPYYKLTPVLEASEAAVSIAYEVGLSEL